MALMVSGLGAGTELTGWKGKGTSHPPSQMPQRRCAQSSCPTPASPPCGAGVSAAPHTHSCDSCSVIPVLRGTSEPCSRAPHNATLALEIWPQEKWRLPVLQMQVLNPSAGAETPWGWGSTAPSPCALPSPPLLQDLTIQQIGEQCPRKQLPIFPLKKKNPIKTFQKRISQGKNKKKLGSFSYKFHHFLCRCKLLLLQLQIYRNAGNLSFLLVFLLFLQPFNSRASDIEYRLLLFFFYKSDRA